jgi:hypothetical protein
LFCRSLSKSSIEQPSTPGAPWLALTFWYASHTSHFEMTNGLSFDFGLSTRFLPRTSVDQTNNPGQSRPFAPPPLRRVHRYYEQVRQPAPRRYSAPHGFCRLCALPLAPGTPAGSRVGASLPTFHVTAADRARVASMPGTTWPVNGYPPDSSWDLCAAPVSAPSKTFRHVNSEERALAFPIPA